MESSKKVIQDYNKKLFAKLFPDKTEPIFCNSVLDENQEATKLSFREIANEHLKNILEEQEFITELEQIKFNNQIN